jgi:integrase
MAKDLTVKALENLKPGAARREVPDGHTRGLFFVLQPSGAASWAFRYRLDGKTAKLTLGPFPGLDLKSARELASEAIKTLARGADPRAAKRDAREAARIAARSERNLVESVVHDFLETHVARNLKASTQYEVGRLLAKELAPWRGRRIDGIDPQDVRRLLDAIVDRGAEITANRLFSALRRMFRWARERRIIERSPCDDIRAPTSERGRARERVLDDPELALVWRAAEALGYPFAPMIRMLILTGQRRNEVAGMRWSEIDFERAIWTIPGARSKNHREHFVPLSPPAIAILNELPRINGAFVFTVTGKTAVSGFSRAKTRLDRAMFTLRREDNPEAAPPTPWVLHDVRRSVASGLAKIGVQLPVIEKVLNHISGSFAGIVSVYQKHSFADEKRAALDAWGHHIERIVRGAPALNIIELSSARG